MMLRLDPAIPRVWRDPRTLQFGVDPVRAVLVEVTPAVEHLVSALAIGVPDTGYRALADAQRLTARDRQRLLEQLTPCLVPDATHRSRMQKQVVVLGTEASAHELARMLDRLELRTDDLSRAHLAVLVASHVVPPSDHRPWLQRDIPHLPIVVTETATTVGPLVVPGASACLHCVGLYRRDADPAWPAIASQLSLLTPPEPNPLRTASAVRLAAGMVVAALGGAPDTGRQWRLSGDGSEVSERQYQPHPGCRCAARPESDWVPANESAFLPQPS